MRYPRLQTILAVAGLLVATIGGCATQGRTGALIGGGIGALAGQAIGGDTAGTLIGAAVGTGIGYIIGNEADKKHAQEMTEQSEAQSGNGQDANFYHTHKEVGALGGTRWLVNDIAPKKRVPPYVSKTVEFRPYGRVITTATKPAGSVEAKDERYRVVGDTLVVNKPSFLINAQFSIADKELIVSADDFRAVLTGMR